MDGGVLVKRSRDLKRKITEVYKVKKASIRSSLEGIFWEEGRRRLAVRGAARQTVVRHPEWKTKQHDTTRTITKQNPLKRTKEGETNDSTTTTSAKWIARKASARRKMMF